MDTDTDREMDIDELANDLGDRVALIVFERFPWTTVEAEEDDGELWVRVKGFYRGDLHTFEYPFGEDEVEDIEADDLDGVAAMVAQDLCAQMRALSN